MRRKKGVGVLELLPCLIVVITGLFLGGVSAWAVGDDDVILYENTNYGGKQLKFTGYESVYDLRQYPLVTSEGSVNWNDRISSVQVGKKKKIVMYEHINYGGASITLYGETVCRNATGQYPSMPSGWNDRVSSFRIMDNDDQPRSMRDVAVNPDCVIVFENINYCGRDAAFYVGDHPDLRSIYGFNWNDRISSIWVGSNVILTVFEHINYGGASFTEVGPSNIPSLVTSGWNDRISSLKVKKR
jgi:hypothetical protein